MLQSIRDRAQGVVAGIIVFGISLTFALWGVQSYFDTVRQVVVAKVNGEELHLATYQQKLQELRNQAEQQLGAAFDPAQWDTEETRLRVLDRLVEETLLTQSTGASNLRVSSQYLQEQIRTIEGFTDPATGGFSFELYQRSLQFSGLSPEGFEERMRNDIVLQQLQAGLMNSAFALPSNSTALQRWLLQRRDIELAVVAAAPLREQAEVTEAEISEYFEANRDSFFVPEKVGLEYLLLSLSSLEQSIEADEETLRAFFERTIGNYTVEETRRARHILLEVPEDAAEQEVAEVRARAEELLAEIEAGAEFAELAGEHSDDIGTAAQGGDLDFFARGLMGDAAFDDAVFNLEVGEVSAPVRTSYGIHLIRLEEVRSGATPTFEEARAEVEQIYRREQAEVAFAARIDEVSDLVWGRDDTLAPAAAAAGLTVQSTEPLSQSEIANRFNRAVADAVFTPDVLVDRFNSNLMELSRDEMVAVRVVEHLPRQMLALEDVRDDIVEQLKDDKARGDAIMQGQALLDALQADAAAAADAAGAAALAAEAGLEWQVHEALRRDASDLSFEILDEAFVLKPPAEGEYAWTGFSLSNGDFVVMRVSDVTNPAASEVTDDAVASNAQAIAAIRAQSDWFRFIEGLRESAEITLYPERI